MHSNPPHTETEPMNHTEMAEAQDAPIPSLPSRIVKVFFSPGQLFEALRNNPAWGGALLTAALVVAVSMAAIPIDVWEQVRARAGCAKAGPDAPEAEWRRPAVPRGRDRHS